MLLSCIINQHTSSISYIFVLFMMEQTMIDSRLEQVVFVVGQPGLRLITSFVYVLNWVDP